MDPGDTPERAAERELLEETGYGVGKLVKIGEANPNPAIFSNRCHTFLARHVKKVCEPTPDQAEDIEVVLVPMGDIPRLIRTGKINHSIVVAAFNYYFLRSR